MPGNMNNCSVVYASGFSLVNDLITSRNVSCNSPYMQSAHNMSSYHIM